MYQYVCVSISLRKCITTFSRWHEPDTWNALLFCYFYWLGLRNVLTYLVAILGLSDVNGRKTLFWRCRISGTALVWRRTPFPKSLSKYAPFCELCDPLIALLNYATYLEKYVWNKANTHIQHNSYIYQTALMAATMIRHKRWRCPL